MSTEYIPWPPADFMWTLAFRDEIAEVAAVDGLYTRAYEVYNYTLLEPPEWDSGYDADTHEYAERSEDEDDSGYDADTIPF